MQPFEYTLPVESDVTENQVSKIDEEISVTQICNSVEQDARRYKKFLGDDV